MKNLNFLSNQSDFGLENGSGMTREWLGIDSTVSRKLFTLLFVLLLGFGQMWGVDATLNFWQSAPGSPTSNNNVSFAYSSCVFGASSANSGIQVNGQVVATMPTGATATKIVIHKTSNSWAKAANCKVYIGSSATAKQTITQPSSDVTINLTGTEQTAGSYKFKNEGSNSKVAYIKDIVITYTVSGTSYTITYNSNGGSGSMANTTGASVSAANCTFTAPTGKQFDHWNTAANNSGTSYAAGATVNKTTTLYAQWACISPTINTQPASANYAIGASPAALSVSATLSSGTLTYLWKVSTNGGSTWSNASGTNNQATYAAANISTASAGTTKYKCIVTNSSGSCSTESNVATITVYATHKAYFYNGSTLLNPGGTDVAEDAAVTYSGSTPVSCDDGEGASSTFVGWATNTWTNKKTAKGDIPAGTTFYDVTASESLPNMSTDDVTYHAVFAKGTEVSTPVANTWTRITNVSQLTDGATVMLVQYYADKAINNTPGATNCTANAEITNSTANLRWIAEKSGNKWKFKTSGGSYLSTSSLADQTTLSLNATYDEWTITVDAGGYSNCFNLNNGNDLEYYSSFKVYAYSSKYASAYPFYIYIQKTTSSTTYSNYMTTCCTPLVSINGSFNRYHLKIFHHIIMSMFISLIFKC